MEKQIRAYNREVDGHLAQTLARANASRQGCKPGEFGYIEGSEIYARTDRRSIEYSLRTLPSADRARAIELLNSRYREEFLSDIQRSDTWKIR